MSPGARARRWLRPSLRPASGLLLLLLGFAASGACELVADIHERKRSPSDGAADGTATGGRTDGGDGAGGARAGTGGAGGRGSGGAAGTGGGAGGNVGAGGGDGGAIGSGGAGAGGRGTGGSGSGGRLGTGGAIPGTGGVIPGTGGAIPGTGGVIPGTGGSGTGGLNAEGCLRGDVYCEQQTPACVVFNASFDDNMTDSWTSSTTTAPFSSFGVKSNVVHGGARSLGVSVANPAATSSMFEMSRILCPPTSTTAYVNGHTFTFWIYWAGPAVTVDPQSGCQLEFSYVGPTTISKASLLVAPVFGAWTRLDSNVIGLLGRSEVLTLNCYVNFPWTGTLYFDDISTD